jgi:nucleoside-diphosphate-sugar epimerase
VRDCVIGHTGFIGSHLAENNQGALLYNSKNIVDIIGRQFDTVYCAGNYGTKWLANKNPKDDWKNIELLMSCIETISANRFVLISTIDVYDNPIGVTEANQIDTNTQSAYGLHRYKFETFIRSRFANHAVLRLPIVYGHRFKKNIIFDLINNNQVEKIDPRAEVQLYCVNNLHDDIRKAIENNIEVINIAVEPIAARDLAQGVFNKTLEEKKGDFFKTDMQSQYGELYNSNDAYLYSKESAMREIREFVLN